MENSETRHETREAPATIPAFAIVSVFLFVALSALGVLALLRTLWREPPAPPSSFASVEKPVGPAPPHLQVNPEADLARLNQRMEKRLHSFGWVDRSAGIIHMPIDQAMDLMVKRGSTDIAQLAPQSHGKQETQTKKTDSR